MPNPPTANGTKPLENAALRSLMRFYSAEARYSTSGDPTDRARWLECLHPEIILYQPESLPYGGVWRGREAFGNWMDLFVGTWTDITPTDPVFYPCDDDMLFSTVTMRAFASSTRNPIIMPMCQMIRFSGDLPIEWRNFAWDTAQMVAALDMTSASEGVRSV